MDLNFKIVNQRLTLTNKTYYANQSNNYLRCTFDFTTTDWQDKSIFILFKNRKNGPYKYSYAGEPILLPASILTDTRFYITIYGVQGETRITTNQLIVLLNKSDYRTDIKNIPEDFPDIADVICERLAGKSELDHTHTVSDITDLTIPTKVSELTNDCGYLREHQSLTDYVKTDDARLSDRRDPKPHYHKMDDIEDLPVIPTKTSQLQNDDGFITLYDVRNKADKNYVDGLIGEINDYILR